MEKCVDYQELLDVATKVGFHLLENGAETYRVEDTMHRILSLSRLQTAEVFLKMLPLLAEKGIRTLGQAREASEKTYHARITY